MLPKSSKTGSTFAEKIQNALLEDTRFLDDTWLLIGSRWWIRLLFKCQM